jgi:cytochrome c-type biogenesis protein CcmH
MTLWLILTILTAGAAVIVIAPFLLRHDGADGTASRIDVYKDQLAEIDRDKEQGLIEEAEAVSARVEIERRILAAAKESEAPAARIGPNWQYRMVTGVAAIVVLGSVGLYAALGRPDLPSAQSQALAVNGQQAAQASNAQETAGLDVAALVQRVEKRVADNPDDPEGWRMLGWSYYNTGRFQDSVTAYRRAVDLQKDNPTLRALYGEAQVKAADGLVTQEALATFEQVLTIDPNDERARFFKGVAKAQKGDNQGAVDEWLALYKIAPADAEWAADLRSRIEETAKEAGIDVNARLAEARPSGGATAAAGGKAAAHPGGAAAPGPTPADIEDAKELSAEDRQAMVAGMVDRLANRLEASPRDADGWIMLIRSRMAMNDGDKARAALEKAKSVFADEPETQQRIVKAAEAMGIAVN